MSSHNSPRIAVLLVNLGTPDEPTTAAVRRYLKQFLSDTRVIEIPPFLWAIILNLFILTTRPKRVAHAYSSIWDGDSPLRKILNLQVAKLQDKFDERVAQNEDSAYTVSVHPAMSYGNPGLPDVMSKLCSEGIEHFVILPLFPQFSASSAGAAYDAVTKWSLKQRNLPAYTIIKDYYAHPLYIQALAESIRRYQAEHGKPDKLMFSFHGIPQPYEDKGDPYPSRCKITADMVAKELQLKDDEWIISFQSRFGLQEWVKPYTDVVLEEWAKEGVGYVQIISPAFSADCLETLEELAIENRDNFLKSGGKEYGYIPALNGDPLHIDLMDALTKPLVAGFAAIANPVNSQPLDTK